MTKDQCGTIGQGAAGVVETPLAPSYRESRPRPVAKQQDHRDLCCVCTYAAECMHRGTAESPKLFCELFDVDVPALERRADGGEDQDGEVKTMGGLCCNCEHRRTCTIRVPEGDVWHCEEYR